MSYTAGVKITVSIPAEVLRKAELLAGRLKLSRSALVTVAVQRFLGGHPTEEFVRAVDRARGDVEDGDLEFLRRAAAEALARIEW